MQPWFEALPGVFEEEKKILGALGFALDLTVLANERRVVFHGASKVDPKRQLDIDYPSGFPSFPPEIKDDAFQPVLQRHQLAANRAFCLFGPNRYRWSAAMNAGDAVEEAETLIRDYGPGAPLPPEEQVPEPLSDLLSNEPFGGFLVPPDIVGVLAVPSTETVIGECELMITPPAAAGRRGIILGLSLKGTRHRTTNGFQHILDGEEKEARNATLVQLAATPPFLEAKQGARPWLDLIPAGKRKPSKGKDEWFLFVYPEESGKIQGRAIGFTVLEVARGEWHCFRCFVLRPQADFSRIPGFEPLAAKKVVVIGVGALGSRIAYCLAASGVGRLVLIDHDVYDPANAVRHECGFASFGLPKVEAVRRRLIQANYRCDATYSTLRIGHITPQDEDKFAKQISESDLVINATAFERASHWLDGYCRNLGKTCLHASVSNGAWGGEVIRVVPNESPCWLCHQAAYEPVQEPAADEGVYPPGCAQPTFTGSLPEVSIVADLAATMAIETLLARPGRDFAGSHIRWTSRSPAGACQPKVEIVTPVARPQCAVCSPKPKFPATSS